MLVGANASSSDELPNILGSTQRITTSGEAVEIEAGLAALRADPCFARGIFQSAKRQSRPENSLDRVRSVSLGKLFMCYCAAAILGQ